MSNEETKLLMTVPRDIIDAQVRAAVALALNKDPGALVKAVVEAALNQKKDSYSRDTIWMEQLNALIREVAKEEFTKWCESMRPEIAKLMKAKLGGNSKALVEQIATKMTSAMTSASVHVSWPESR